MSEEGDRDRSTCVNDVIVQLMTSSFLCNLLRSHNRGWQPGFRSTLPAVRQHQFRCRRLLRGAHSRLLHSPAGWASIYLNVKSSAHDVMLRAHDVIPKERLRDGLKVNRDSILVRLSRYAKNNRINHETARAGFEPSTFEYG